MFILQDDVVVCSTTDPLDVDDKDKAFIHSTTCDENFRHLPVYSLLVVFRR